MDSGGTQTSDMDSQELLKEIFIAAEFTGIGVREDDGGTGLGVRVE